VDSKAIRTIVIFGIIAVFALTAIMMFSLDQMADTQTPQIALDLAKDLQRGLAASPPAPVKLTMTRDGKGVRAPRVYSLRIRPAPAVALDDRAVQRLMYRASELCAAQVGDVQCDVTIRCTAEMPDGTEKEAAFVKDKIADPRGLALIHAVAPPPAPVPAPAPTDPR
jgi:hypothetical protein